MKLYFITASVTFITNSVRSSGVCGKRLHSCSLFLTTRWVFEQFLPSSVQCCFTSTETVGTIRDREPRTATSTLTQLLSSDDSYIHSSLLLNVHRNRRDGEPRTATSTFI